jgi:hypothetical protein
MEENATVLLKMRARHGLSPRMIGVEGCSPQDDILAVEGAVALANRHRRLSRVVPHGGEAIRFGIEAGNSSASALRSIWIEEGEIRLQKLAVLDHVLLTRSFCLDRFSVYWKEGLNEVPVAHELREQLLAGAGCVWRLVLIVSLLRHHRNGNEQNRKNEIFHSKRMICEKRNPCTGGGSRPSLSAALCTSRTFFLTGKDDGYSAAV